MSVTAIITNHQTDPRPHILPTANPYGVPMLWWNTRFAFALFLWVNVHIFELQNKKSSCCMWIMTALLILVSIILVICIILFFMFGRPFAQVNTEPFGGQFQVSEYQRLASGGGGTEGTECTSQCVGKNRRCQRVCLNRRCVCRFAGSVGFYPRAARYILYPLYPARCPHLVSESRDFCCI
jgi:hypothetical protein